MRRLRVSGVRKLTFDVKRLCWKDVSTVSITYQLSDFTYQCRNLGEQLHSLKKDTLFQSLEAG